MSAKADPFFPTIGDVAEKTDQLPDNDDEILNAEGAVGSATGDEDRPMQEIESLCMSCGEQVTSELVASCNTVLRRLCVSRDQHGYFSSRFPTFVKSLSCPSDANTAVFRIMKSSLPVRSGVRDDRRLS